MTEGLSNSEKQLKRLIRKARKNRNGCQDGSNKTHWDKIPAFMAINAKEAIMSPLLDCIVVYLRLYDFMANSMFANQFGFRH